MKQVFSITLRTAEGILKVVNVLIDGKVRDAMTHAETANPGSEAISGNPVCVVHLEVA